jgi:hypothetical protein
VPLHEIDELAGAAIVCEAWKCDFWIAKCKTSHVCCVDDVPLNLRKVWLGVGAIQVAMLEPEDDLRGHIQDRMRPQCDTARVDALVLFFDDLNG